MAWIINNWSFLVVIACAVGVCIFYAMRFTRIDKQQQIKIAKTWLLYAVIEAERIYKSGTGTLKLHYVYTLFVDKFKPLAAIVPFEVFARWVDEVLVEMRRILETNRDIEAYVNDD